MTAGVDVQARSGGEGAPRAAGQAEPSGPALGPLAGVRVADFSHIAAGPYGTLQLAYFGADVVKVESSRHLDGWRTRDGNADMEESRPFADHNKNKRSVTLDLKHPDGREVARRFVAHCDVVVENFSFGVMERLGLGYDELREVRPDLVMVSLQGLGRSGPRREWVTWGPSLMPLCGLSYLWNHPGAAVPTGSQTSYPDYVVALHAAALIVAALLRRDRCGRGCHIEMSQAEVTATLIGCAFVEQSVTGSDPLPRGNDDRRYAPHGCFPCLGEDRWCVIAVVGDEQWRALAALMGRADLRDDPELATVAGRRRRSEELDHAVSAWTAQLPAREVMERCQRRGIAAGMVASGEDVVSDPHLAARGFLVDTGHPRQPDLLLPSAAVRLSDASVANRPAPLLGQHTREVLAGVVGLDAAEIDALERVGALR